jgi:hypothetical protein
VKLSGLLSRQYLRQSAALLHRTMRATAGIWLGLALAWRCFGRSAAHCGDGRPGSEPAINPKPLRHPSSGFAGRVERRRKIGPLKMMKVAKTAFVFLSLIFPGSAYAENLAGIEISAAEQQACGPDVIKLCSDVFPDVSRVLGCMKSKRSQVSPTCMKVARARGL